MSHLIIRNVEFNRIPRKNLNKIYKYSSSKDIQCIYKICVFNFYCIPRKSLTKIKCIDALKKQTYLKSHVQSLQCSLLYCLLLKFEMRFIRVNPWSVPDELGHQSSKYIFWTQTFKICLQSYFCFLHNAFLPFHHLIYYSNVRIS